MRAVILKQISWSAFLAIMLASTQQTHKAAAAEVVTQRRLRSNPRSSSLLPTPLLAGRVNVPPAPPVQTRPPCSSRLLLRL